MNTYTTKCIRRKLYFDNNLVLDYQVTYPLFVEPKHPYIQSKIELEIKVFEHMCKTTLYKQAIETYKDSIASNFPFHSYQAVLKYNISFTDDKYISYYYDQYTYTGGAHGSTIRRSDTWDTLLKRKITLDMIDESKNYLVSKQAVIYQISLNKETYFDDANKRVYQTFNPKQFYFVNDYLILYFQQYDIAPYSTGIPTFSFSLKNE